MMKYLATMFLALWLCVPVMAQELWQGARVGDTVADIKSRFPEATPPEKEIDYEGYEVPLIIDQREIGQYVFDVYFMMVDKKLNSVRLYMSEKETGERPYEFTFNNLMPVLSERYGAPFHNIPVEMESPDFMQRLNNEFRQNDLRVEVNCFFCRHKLATLHVTYSAVRSHHSQGF